MWKARKTAKHGMATPSELWELKTFEAAIKSWKADEGKVLVEGSEARIRAWSRKQKLKWMQNRLRLSRVPWWTQQYTVPKSGLKYIRHIHLMGRYGG